MKTVVFRHDYRAEGRQFAKGEVVNLDDATAEQLAADGIVEVRRFPYDPRTETKEGKAS